jgi:hypothetical protein
MASLTISDGRSAGCSSELALPGIAPRRTAEVNVDSTPLCSGKSRDEAGCWSLDRAFDVILNREISFGVASKAVKKKQRMATTLVPFRSDSPQIPPGCYLHSREQVADNY